MSGPQAAATSSSPFKVRWALMGVLFVPLALSACASDGLYASGRNVQRAECLKLADAAARDRCLKDAAMPQRTYQRETDAARR